MTRKAVKPHRHHGDDNSDAMSIVSCPAAAAAQVRQIGRERGRGREREREKMTEMMFDMFLSGSARCSQEADISRESTNTSFWGVQSSHPSQKLFTWRQSTG